MARPFPTVVALSFAVAACTGLQPSHAEVAAISTCNAWLLREVSGMFGRIDPKERVVRTGIKSIDIRWTIKGRVGSGPALCSTNLQGNKVIDVDINGLDVDFSE